ncbi:MAG: hypothetical protein HY290_25125 [Planctomycetia bacterium]|nr:hypothetical protein [Planctomycetia bacterium]
MASLGLAGLAVLATAPRAGAQGGAGVDVFRVEEDWELVVDSADSNINGPQITCSISPLTMDYAYAAFDVNYHTQPEYSAGGLQLHTWDPLDPIEYANSTRTGMLATAGETVTWTQTMTLNAGVITYRVCNGQSDTWGNFGHGNSQQGHLTLDMPSTLSNLNGYTTQVSLDNSGVSFASNLVGSLRITAVRWYDANGNLIQENNASQAVHPQD